MADESNPILSSKPSDSNLNIALHPLVLLTVSDHITRHRVRRQEGLIVGALLGQQKGREITIEHAFQCKTITTDSGDVILHQEWFETRLQQYKDVHKFPVLDLVGWFTLCPESGPTAAVLPIQKQIIWTYNESALLLSFHASAVSSSAPSINGKLPFTVYESTFEADHSKDDGSMQVDGEENSGLKFRALTYSIETDETEMIAIDYVAEGGGNAIAVSNDEDRPSSPDALEMVDKKGKKRADRPAGEKMTNGTKRAMNSLLPEEEDQIAGMTTRLNSVRMLQARLSLLSAFIRSQEASYLSDSAVALSQTCPDPAQLPHLRNIQALLSRLSLLTPSIEPATATVTAASSSTSADALTLALRSQANDVALSRLLSLLGQDVQGMSELGRKFAAVEQGKVPKSKGKGTFGGMTVGSDDIGMGMGSMLV